MQLLHHVELRCSCLGGTCVEKGLKPCSPSRKLMPVVLLHLQHFGCLFLSFLCTYSLSLLASHYCFSSYITKQKPKLLLRNYLCKIPSRHHFLLLTAGLCLPIFFGYKAQNMAEGEAALREKNLSRARTRPKGKRV